MLAFDIETTGLKSSDIITAACLYDPERDIEYTYIFALGDDPSDFIKQMDNADQLCAFNGARFDIPFMQREWQIPQAKIQEWRLKLFDIYEMSIQVFKKGFSLNQLLMRNGIPVKTGSGKDAIVLAQTGQWAELGDYCMHDTKKTYAVSNLSRVHLPLHTTEKICLVNENNINVYFEIQ